MDVFGLLERGFGRVNSIVFRQVNRFVPWYRSPQVPALLNVRALALAGVKNAFGPWKQRG